MMDALGSSETSVLTRATRRYIQEDGILHSHRREILKSYIELTGYIFTKRKQLRMTLTKTHWLLGRKSKLSTSKKENILIHKAIFKPMWTYGTQLWGAASTSNTEILERFQSKVLRMIADAPWYVLNTVNRRDLQTPTVKGEIRHYSFQYRARLSVHPNDLVVNLMAQPDNRRLRRRLPNDLPTRF
jgi:hypothetical protein